MQTTIASRIASLVASKLRSVVNYFYRPQRAIRAATVRERSALVMSEPMRDELRLLIREELRDLLADATVARSLRHPFVGTLFPLAAGTRVGLRTISRNSTPRATT